MTKEDKQYITAHSACPEHVALLTWLFKHVPTSPEDTKGKIPKWWNKNLQGLSYIDEEGKKRVQKYPIDPQDPEGLNFVKLSMKTKLKWEKIFPG